MEVILKGILNGLKLLFTFDPETWFIISVSIRVAVGGTLVAGIFGLPLGFVLATRSFRGRRAVEVVVNTLVGVPTVVVGLFFFCLFSRTIGLLATFELLYTRTGMIIALGALGTPLAASLTNTAIRAVDPALYKAALTLGATPLRASRTLISEARHGILAAVAIVFGRLISEVGIATMIGANIKGRTRTMTTYIALETEKGEFQYAFALGVALLAIVFAVNLFLNRLQKKDAR